MDFAARRSRVPDAVEQRLSTSILTLQKPLHHQFARALSGKWRPSRQEIGCIDVVRFSGQQPCR